MSSLIDKVRDQVPAVEARVVVLVGTEQECLLWCLASHRTAFSPHEERPEAGPANHTDSELQAVSGRHPHGCAGRGRSGRMRTESSWMSGPIVGEPGRSMSGSSVCDCGATAIAARRRCADPLRRPVAALS